MNLPDCIEPADPSAATPILAVRADALEATLAALQPDARAWVQANGFAARPDTWIAVPDGQGGIALVLAGIEDAADPRALSALPNALPEGRYALHPALGERIAPGHALLGWGLGAYRFTRYLKAPRAPATLVLDPAADLGESAALLEACTRVRDLVNTPTQDLGPEELEAAARALAQRHGAQLRVVKGEDLLRENFPAIHAVGRASHRAPRLIELTWGDPSHPRLALVGKGVCFDTGGLDIKPPASMGLMKKDMGGAATAMGLAEIVMSLGLDIRLRVLVPAVENAIASAAMRPGDILPSRKGLTVEVNNTDAEGRLVLADALAVADEEAPELVVSLATLTGAARVALGPDVPPFFTDDEALAAELAAASARVADPLWRLPFWTPYEPLIEPGIADLDNAPSGGMAGAITAALFLRRFVTASPRYLHLDIYGWTPTAKPARPKGAAFQAARALLALLEDRYCRT